MSKEWKLVPVEPTREMLVAGGETFGLCPVYAAMIAAAPVSPQADAQPVAEISAQVESALRRSFSLGQVYWQQADSDSTCQQNKSDQTMEVQQQHILNVLKSIKAALSASAEPANKEG